MKSFNPMTWINRKASNPIYKNVIKHAPRYFGGSFLTAIVTVLMTKYYTHVYSVYEYGVLSLYLTLFQYFQNLFTFGFDSSFQRFYFDYDKEEKQNFLNSILNFILLSSIFWIGIISLTGSTIINHFGGSWLILSVTLLMTLCIILVNFFNRVCYNESLSGIVLKQNLLQNAINHFGSVLLIGILKIGIAGRLIGQGIAIATNMIFYASKLKQNGHLHYYPHIRWDHLRKVYAFALPTFLTTLLASSFSLTDRILLNYFHGKQEVGVYSLGYTLGQGISLIIEATSMALFPTLMKGLQENYESNIEKIKKFDKVFCSSLIVIGLIIFIFKDLLVALLSNSEYKNASLVIPFIVCGFIMGGFYKTVGQVLAFHKKIWFYPLITILSYSTSALLNILLIPKYNELGAAYSTFLGLFLYSLMVHLFGSRYFYSIKKILLIYIPILIIMTALFLYLSE